jgi:hypothetical protein
MDNETPDLELDQEPDFDVNEFPLGPLGPTQEVIDELTAKHAPSLVYAVFFGGENDFRCVIVRTIRKSEYMKIKQENMSPDDVEEFILNNYVVWPEKQLLHEWAEVFGGLTGTVSEATFQYSGFTPIVIGKKL